MLIFMGLSLAERFAQLPPEERLAWVREQPLDVLTQIARGEWWWTSRPEQIPPPGDWFIHLALAGRGWGKALCLTTPIPTVDGWTTMAEIKETDTVIAADGTPTRVQWVGPVMNGRPCYRVTFTDGSTIVADAEHEWSARSRADRRVGRPYRTVTTAEMLAAGLTVAGESRWQMPAASEIQLPTRALPVDPYVLGFWLGDGHSQGAEFTIGDSDAVEVISLFAQRGVTLTKTAPPLRYAPVPQRPARGPDGRMVANGSLRSALRALGVWGNKHIPAAYLRAAAAQRQELLAGLIDSDGYVEHATGRIEYTTIREPLAQQVAELARMAGHRARIIKSIATLDGVEIGPKFRVQWVARSGGGHLARKRLSSRHHLGQPDRLTTRYVASIEPVPTRPVRCIAVEHPSHLYLAGERWLVTHNSRAGSEWLIDRTQLHPTDRHGTPTEWLVIAETLADARTICVEGPAGLLRVLERREIKYKYIKHPKPTILVGPTETKIYFEGADDADVGRGYNAAGAWLDEICKWKYLKESWEEGIMPSLRADLLDDHPRVFVTTTPKPVDLIREWVARTDGSISLVRGSTFDNRANLSAMTLAEMEKRYAGTTIGRQELYGELIENMDGALFKFTDIERHRTHDLPELEIARVCAVDPALTGEDDEMGIVVASRDPDNHIHILADESTMGSGRPAALHAWRTFARWECDVLLYESNLGKVWMAQVLEDAYKELMKTGMFPDRSTPPMKAVDSKHGKKTRAEPVAMRYEQGRVHHVGRFETLENQMVEWDPMTAKDSPDRLDALVHAVRFLIEGERREVRIHTPTSRWLPNVRATM